MAANPFAVSTAPPAAALTAVTAPIPDPVLPENAPTADIQTAVSAELGEYIQQKLYPAISARRDTIASFYSSPETVGEATTPVILFNGNQYDDGASFQKMIMEGVPLNLDIETINAVPVNTALVTKGGQHPKDVKKGKDMTVLVMISGTAVLGEAELDDERIFSDSLMLVPNPDFEKEKKKGATSREWLVQTHTFRFVS